MAFYTTAQGGLSYVESVHKNKNKNKEKTTFPKNKTETQ